MKPTLKQYQQDGINFLADNKTKIPYHSILGDDMGLGKTAQAICACGKVKANKILVICPSAVKINWMREFLKWSDYSKIFIAGRDGKIAAKDCVIDREAQVVIVNYDLCIMSKIKKQLGLMSFDVCILDECHYLMNKTSGRTKAILARGGIIWNCKYKWALSGTFMKNRNRDCFAILRALFPHVMGKYTDYRNYAEYFCGGRMGTFGYDDTSSTHTEELGAMLSQVMIRRTRAEVLKELPPITEQNIYLEITPEIASVLGQESEFTEEQITAILNLQMLGETASYRKDLAMAKLPQVVNYAKDVLANVNKLTIFAYHRDFINTLAEKLSEYGVEVVMGGLTDAKKQEKVDNFVNNPDIRVFIGQIQAAGTGVDGLQFVCSDVIFAEIDWVPGTIDQARARCHRMGQKNNAHIHYLLVEDSLETKMLNVLRTKRYKIKSVMTQVEKEVITKGEKSMTLESTLERIAASLEKIAANMEKPSVAQEVVQDEKTVKETKPKTTRSKVKAQSEAARVTEKVVAEAVAEATADQVVEPVKPVAETKPEKSLDEIKQQCAEEAAKLGAKIGRETATLYINGVTAQVTGIENARLSNCNIEQAECVLDAIIAKLNEEPMGEI